MTVPAVVNSVAIDGPIETQTISFGFTVTAGHLILCGYFKRDGFTEPLPVPTGYTLVDDFGSGGSFQDGVGVFAKDAAGGETGFDMPDVFGGGTGDVLVVLELDAGVVAELVTSQAGVTSANPITGSITPVAGADALLVTFASAAHDTTATWSVDAAWTILHQRTHGNGHPIDLTATRGVTNASGSYAITASEAAAHNKRMIMVAVKGAAPAIVPKVSLTINAVSFEDPLEVRARFELNAAGSIFIRLRRSDPQATEANLARGSVIQLVIPEIHNGVLAEFFLQEGDFTLLSSDEEGGEELAFSGPGTLSYLARAVLDYVEYGGGVGTPRPSKGVWTFDERKTEGYMVDKMIEEAQHPSRPSDPIPALTQSFSSTLDTDGVAWADQTLEGRWKERIGANMLEAILRLVRAGLMNIEMAPGFVLNLWRTLGRDLTGLAFGTGVVRFVDGVNIASELSRDMAGIVWATHAVVRYGDGSYTRAVKDGGTPYDQETYIESNSDSAATARRQAKGQMALREGAQESLLLAARVPWPGAGNDEASGIYLPGPSWSDNGLYWLGDTVTLHTGTDDFDYDNASRRIFAIELRSDETGYLAPPIVELNAPYKRTAQQIMSGQLGTITGGSGSSSGAGTPGSGGTTTVPFSPWKEAVRAATTANVTIATALNDGDSLDGVTLADGDRVLVKDQTDASENGIYQVGASPSRTSDFDAGDEVVGAVVQVLEGTANAGTTWRTSNTTEPTVDTDDIDWEAFGGTVDAELNIEGGQSVISAHGSTGATETIDPTAGNVHTLTLDADCTITLDAPVGSGACTLELWVTEDGTGGRDITWPVSVTEQGTHDTTAGTTQRCVLETIDGGTTWVATWIGTGEPVADAHIADTTDAHDASAISIADSGGYFTGTDVEAALQELGASTVSAADLVALGVVGPLLISDDHSTPIVFGDILLTEEGDDFLYADLGG